MSKGNSNEVRQRDTLGQRVNQILVLPWIIVGVVVIIQSRKLKYMAQWAPGAGFLPFWLGVGFILLGCVLLIQVTFSHKKREIPSLPSKLAAIQMFLVMAGYFIFVFLADKVGFLLGIGLLFFFLLTAVERKGWKLSLIISVINIIIFWVIFEMGLQLGLPKGFLDLLR